MFCKKCGSEIKNGAKFCGKCGTEINIHEVNTVSVNNKSHENNIVNAIKNNNKVKNILIIVAVIVVIIIGYIIYTVTHSSLSVNDVRDGILYGYKSETIGEALEDYFSDCSWDSFVADSDETIDVVEFVGYDASGRKFKMQFIHNYSDDNADIDEFEIYGCWIDGDVLGENEQSQLIYCIYNDMDRYSNDYTYDYIY